MSWARPIRPRRVRAARRAVNLSLLLAAPAFYERRSCLPQLDCEHPRGRDPDPHFFGIRPTFMCYVPSPVLASVGDTGESQPQGPHLALMSPQITLDPRPHAGSSQSGLGEPSPLTHTHPLNR